MTSLEIALTFSLRNTRDIPSRSNSKRNKQYSLTVNWQASIYFPMPHQSGAPFASVRSFLKEQWYRAGVFFLPSPSPLSFFRPRTCRKGYYFYSPQSSTVIKSKMAATTTLRTRTRFRPPKIRLQCWLRTILIKQQQEQHHIFFMDVPELFSIPPPHPTTRRC